MAEVGSVYTILVCNLKEGDRLRHLNADGRIVLKWILNRLSERVDLIHLSQDRDQCRLL